MNILRNIIRKPVSIPQQVHSLHQRNQYNYRPFQDIVENQILRRLYKFNQELYLNQKNIDYYSNVIFKMHNSQNLIFLFRLFKLFSITNEQFELLNEAQKQKYKDFHKVRQQANKINYQIRLSREKLGLVEQKKQEEGRKDEEEEEDYGNENEEEFEKKVIQNKSYSNELTTLYVMRAELKEVIWSVINLHTGHIENAFLYHIFMNKSLNKLIALALDREKEADFHYFSGAYLGVDRTLVTAEQMCLLIQLLSMNEHYEGMPDIFDEELESILQIVSNQEVNYMFGKFIIRLGLNHLEEIEKKDTRVSSLLSKNFNMLRNKQIHLDQLSLSLYLFDLKNKKHGVDADFFQKFNTNNILQKIPLHDIDQLLSAFKNEEKEGQPRADKKIEKNILKQIIENSMTQAENFKVYNEVLLNQLRLIIKYKEYADLNQLANLLNQISSEIINQTSGKAILSNTFTNYIVEFLNIVPSNLIDFYQLFDAFFQKQSIEGISYKQLIAVYKQMANTGVDYDDYLQICHKVFFMNKSAIISEKLNLEIIALASVLQDAETAEVFGVKIEKRKQLPGNVEYLSDFSESEDEGEAKSEQKKEI